MNGFYKFKIKKNNEKEVFFMFLIKHQLFDLNFYILIIVSSVFYD